MDDILGTLIREIGPTGLLVLALLGVVRTLKPAIDGLMKSMTDAADARREQAKTNEAVLTRWKESDSILDGHSKAFSEAMTAVAEEIRDLKITDSQRIRQNDVTAAQITGAREDIRTLSTDFVKGKDDAVLKVNQAMDDKLKPIESTLQNIQQQVADALALLRAMEGKPAQAVHHSGSVSLLPNAAPPAEDEEKSA